MNKIKNNSGQAVLIVLLIVAVILGLGLSIVSQSTTDVKISKQEQEGSRAFNAAEAGIEEALKSIVVGSGQQIVVDDITVSYDVVGSTVIEGKFNENESLEVTLSGADLALNTVNINWVDEDSLIENPASCVGSSSQAPASLLVTVIDDLDRAIRYGVNACALNAENGLSDVSISGDGGYLRKFSVSVGVDDQLIRIRPLYNQASFMIYGNVDLPNQAYEINSSAQVETLESKAIEVTRTEPASPSIFDYALFSGTSIVK